MRTRDDTPPHHKPRQLKPRHQLNRRPRMLPRNRSKRRHQAHQIAKRPRKNNQHASDRTAGLLVGPHRDTVPAETHRWVSRFPRQGVTPAPSTNRKMARTPFRSQVLFLCHSVLCVIQSEAKNPGSFFALCFHSCVILEPPRRRMPAPYFSSLCLCHSELREESRIRRAHWRPFFAKRPITA